MRRRPDRRRRRGSRLRAVPIEVSRAAVKTLPAAELHLDGCPASVGHRQNRIDLTPVGVAIVMHVSAQGLRVDEQVVDNCGFKEETECFQVVVR